MKIKSRYLFPKPYWFTQIDLNINDLQEECYALRTENPGIRKSNRGENSYHSPNINNLDKKPTLKFLMQKILRCANLIHKNSREGTLELGNFWININSRGGFNLPHTHAGAVYSGVYYIKIPSDKKKSGNFSFYREMFESHLSSQACMGRFKDGYNQSPYDQSIIPITPKEKMLILFPSWVAHGVDSNQTDEDRISLSFNFKLKKK